MDDLSQVQKLVESEFGPDVKLHLGGLQNVLLTAIANGCTQPDWFVMAMEAGLRAAVMDVEFARKLTTAMGYGRQVAGNADTDTQIDTLVSILLDVKRTAEFGRLPEGE